MAKFVQTPDGITHQLPDSVTDENYLEEKERFLANYNKPQFQSQPQPQPQPQPQTRTIPTDELSHTQKVLQSLIPIDLNFTETEESSFGKQVIGVENQAKIVATFYVLFGIVLYYTPDLPAQRRDVDCGMQLYSQNKK